MQLMNFMALKKNEYKDRSSQGWYSICVSQFKTKDLSLNCEYLEDRLISHSLQLQSDHSVL